MAGQVRTLIIVAGIAGSLSGCASAIDWAFETTLVDRSAGRRIAEQRCANCHSIDGRTPSPATGARNFSQIAERYTGRSLEWELETITEVGHFGMPPLALGPAERTALVAYIHSRRP